MSRRATGPKAYLFLALTLLGLGPVWAFKYFPTQDGPSHLLSAEVFRNVSDPRAPASEFYERRLSPIPNWTASLALTLLTTILAPFTAERVLVSLYVVGLPLAFCYFLASVEGDGCATLGLLFIWNSCLFRGFYSYCLGIGLLFVILGWSIRRPGSLSLGNTVWVSVLLTTAYFTHLVIFLIAAFCLLWLALTGTSSRLSRFVSVCAAALPSAILTFQYLVQSGFFGTSEVPSARDIALEEFRGLAEHLREAPVALYRELFGAYAGAYLLGVTVLVMALWFTSDRMAGSAGSIRLRRSVLALSAMMFLLFAVIPDTLRAHGGFLKARLAPLAMMLALGAVGNARRTALSWRDAASAAFVVANLALVYQHEGQLNREVEEFTAGVKWVHAGETVASVKSKAATDTVADPFFSEYYCIDSHAICLSSYEGGTQHFPLKFRPGVKHRVRLNRPGHFWTTVVIGWDAEDDELPQPREPYLEVFRDGRLRVFRREEGREPPGAPTHAS